MKGILPTLDLLLVSLVAVFGFFPVSSLATVQPTTLQTLVAGNWIMGCDNQAFCAAIGYYEPNRETENSSLTYVHNTVWYVKIEWNQIQDNLLSLQFYIFDGQPTDTNMTLSQNSSKGHPYELKLRRDEDNKMDFYSTTLKADEFLMHNTLTLSYSYQDEKSDKQLVRQGILNLGNFKAFLKNNHLRQDVLVDLRVVDAFPWANKVPIEKPLLKIWLEKYSEPTHDGCYDSQPSYIADDNYMIDIENFGSLVVLCHERGHNGFVTLWQRDGDDLIPIEFSPQSLTLLEGDDIIYQNQTISFSLDEVDQYLFRATFRGRILGDCGGQYTFVFNGQQANLHICPSLDFPL